MNAPAFQFYADDFLAGTMEFSLEEVGAYIRLLCFQWNRGSIPVQPEKAQRLACGPVSDDVLAKFPIGDDGLRRNARLELERAKQTEYREKQRLKGLASGKSRRNHGSTTVQPRLGSGSNRTRTEHEPSGEPNTNSPSPSPSPKKEEEPASPWLLAFEVEMPEKLRTEKCMAAARLWLQFKKEQFKFTYRPIGLQASVAEWARELTAETFPAAVQKAIARAWKGIVQSQDGSLPISGSKYQPLLPDDRQPGETQEQWERRMVRQAQ